MRVIHKTGIKTHTRIACFIVQAFFKRNAEKGQSKQHCMCNKEKQNKLQSFLRNQSSLKLPLAYVWLKGSLSSYE